MNQLKSAEHSMAVHEWFDFDELDTLEAADKLEALIKNGTVTQIQGEVLGEVWDMLVVAYAEASANGDDLQVYVRRVQSESDGLHSVDALGELTKDQIEGLIDEGEYYRIRNGVTMDSGSSVFVMPSGWLAMFDLEESEGQRKGQTYQAAAKGSKPIVNEGQRTIKFVTAQKEKRKMVCQVAGVNKILASVGQVCDGGNEVIFRQDGGEIVNLKTGKRTPFRRVGNVYVMDAWIEKPQKPKDSEGDVNMGFSGPSVK